MGNFRDKEIALVSIKSKVGIRHGCRNLTWCKAKNKVQ